MSDPKPNPVNAALACARMLSSADAILREADRLRVTRDELLAAIATNDAPRRRQRTDRQQRQAVAQ